MHQTKAYARLRGLMREGLVTHETPMRGAGVFLATKSGLRVASVDLSPATVSPATFAHDLEIVEVAIRLEAIPGAVVESERELRRRAGETAALLISGRRGEASRHFPDLALQLDGERWAVEVELTRKSRERVEAKLRAYQRASAYQTVCFFVRDATMRDWIQERASAARLDDRRLVTRLLDGAPIQIDTPPNADAEIRAFVTATATERDRMLDAWTTRYGRNRKAA